MNGPLVVLLHLCDSLFPIGSFAHSDGLESATSMDRIRTADDLAHWLDATLRMPLEQCDGPAVRIAWEAFTDSRPDTLAAIDAELWAMRPSASGREAGRAMGTRLLKTWAHIRPDAGIEGRLGGEMSFMLPVAFAIVAAASLVPPQETIEAYMYTRLASTVSAAMRLIALGQHDGHRLLANVLARVPAAAERIMARDAPIRSFAPALDVAAMSQQYGFSRLFRS